MAITVSVDGLRELDAALGELSKGVARNTLRRALLKAGQPMADLMREMAPDDPATSGVRDLGDSITISTRADGADAGKAAFSQALSGGGSRGDALSAMKAARAGGAFAEVYIGPTGQAFHGRFQEFGTPHHGPQPFVRPAFDADAPAVIDRLRAEMTTEIAKSVGRARKKAARKAI